MINTIICFNFLFWQTFMMINWWLIKRINFFGLQIYLFCVFFSSNLSLTFFWSPVDFLLFLNHYFYFFLIYFLSIIVHFIYSCSLRFEFNIGVVKFASIRLFKQKKKKQSNRSSKGHYSSKNWLLGIKILIIFFSFRFLFFFT